MIVVSIVDCPLALRGDLTKWLFEINTGIYVGQVSSRVREELWKRIKESAKTGRATMVFSTNNEQGMDFRVHNSGWEPIDFDGLKLMLKPSPARLKKKDTTKIGFSSAGNMRKAKRMTKRNQALKEMPEDYAVIDLETTGLSLTEDEIIEIGAIKVCQNVVIDELNFLIKLNHKIPDSIVELTGITNSEINKVGIELSEAILCLISFIGELPLVLHNADFDLEFLKTASEKYKLPIILNTCFDTLAIAKRTLINVENYKLGTLLNYFDIKYESKHRSIGDCYSTYYLLEKLKKIGKDREQKRL
jgi:CRISPR-associated protein Cas2